MISEEQLEKMRDEKDIKGLIGALRDEDHKTRENAGIHPGRLRR